MNGSVIAGETCLVQAKRYGKHINRAHVAAFSAVLAAGNCGGIFIHTGRTGVGAKDVATADPKLTIVSSQRLRDFVNMGNIEMPVSEIEYYRKAFERSA